ncbi:MAG: NTP transferase domain-containing protein [Candidatus Baltobacteraceae bacterium]
MNAVITAGGRVTGDFALEIGTPVKALAPIGGSSLLDRAVAAAREAGATRIAVVGGDEVRASGAKVDFFIHEAPTGAQNVHLALSAYGDEAVMYLTSDLPFISGAHVRAFMERTPVGSLGVPLAAAGDYERRFPRAPEHATTIGRERISNGSVFLIPAGAARVIDSMAQRLFSARKDLARMAVMLGPSLLLKFALRRLTIADVERKAASLLGFSAFAVRDCAPELCFDIDTIEDYRYALEHA